MKMIQLKNKKGFTLVELIIALGVFSAGIMAAFTLALAGLKTSKENYARIQSANLAREGIELIRNARDTNWVKIDANEDCDTGTEEIDLCSWNNGLSSGYYYTDFVYTIAEVEESSLENISSCAVCAIYFEDMHVNADNRSFFTMTPTGYLPTNMKRLIEIKNICEDESITMGTCSEEIIGLEVISRVYWELLSKEHYVDVKEKLYNWKRW